MPPLHRRAPALRPVCFFPSQPSPTHTPPPAGFDPSRTTTDIGILVAYYFLFVLLALGVFFLRLPRQRSGRRARWAAAAAAGARLRTASGRLLSRAGSAGSEGTAAAVAGGAPGVGSKRFSQPNRSAHSAASDVELSKPKAVKAQLLDTPSTAELLPASATTTNGAEVAVAADGASSPLASGLVALNS